MTRPLDNGTRIEKIYSIWEKRDSLYAEMKQLVVAVLNDRKDRLQKEMVVIGYNSSPIAAIVIPRDYEGYYYLVGNTFLGPEGWWKGIRLVSYLKQLEEVAFLENERTMRFLRDIAGNDIVICSSANG